MVIFHFFLNLVNVKVHHFHLYGFFVFLRGISPVHLDFSVWTWCCPFQSFNITANI